MLGDNLILTTMETIKSYTDLQQSKKLANILSLESADMYYDRYGTPSFIDKYVTHESIKNDKYQHLIAAWSLAALLDILPEHNLQRTDWGNKTEYKIVVTTDEDNYASKNYDNPLDACYEMILKLHELKIL